LGSELVPKVANLFHLRGGRCGSNEQQGVLQVPPKTKEQGKRINGRGRTISRAATRATRAKERMKNKGNENGK